MGRTSDRRVRPHRTGRPSVGARSAERARRARVDGNSRAARCMMVNRPRQASCGKMREELGLRGSSDCGSSARRTRVTRISTVTLLPFVCAVEEGMPRALEHAELRWVEAVRRSLARLVGSRPADRDRILRRYALGKPSARKCSAMAQCAATPRASTDSFSVMRFEWHGQAVCQSCPSGQTPSIIIAPGTRCST